MRESELNRTHEPENVPEVLARVSDLVNCFLSIKDQGKINVSRSNLLDMLGDSMIAKVWKTLIENEAVDKTNEL